MTSARRGTTTVEAAICITLVLWVMFGMLDLGLMAFQSNMLSLAARRVAREAIVRGSSIAPASAWGSATFSGIANDGSAISQVARPYLVTFRQSAVTVEVTWPDGTNRIDDRVHAHVVYQRQPMTPMTSWMGTINLHADSTMLIVH